MARCLRWAAQKGHNVVVMNAGASLHAQFRRRACQADSNDMRLSIQSAGLYTYPDVIAVCGEQRFLDDQVDTLLNPSLIVEVLSPSTEAYGRGRKFEHYKTIGSLREYLMITPDRIHADLFVRQDDGRWLLYVRGPAGGRVEDRIGGGSA